MRVPLWLYLGLLLSASIGISEVIVLWWQAAYNTATGHARWSIIVTYAQWWRYWPWVDFLLYHVLALVVIVNWVMLTARLVTVIIGRGAKRSKGSKR